MGKKTVWNRTKKDAKELSRTARVGETYYVICHVSDHAATYGPAQYVSAHTVEFMHPLLGGAMICGSLSVEGMVLREGPVYSYHPRTPGGNEIPLLGGKQQQVHGPLGADIHREFSDYEITQMEKQVEANRADRKRKSSWW